MIVLKVALGISNLMVHPGGEEEIKDYCVDRKSLLA